MVSTPEKPLHERISALRTFAQSFPSPSEAAAALGVSAGTLRRNTDYLCATSEALDVIEERMPHPVRGAQARA